MIENMKAAFSSIWSNKIRSVLTVLGVIIGITSVTILVSLGEGLKKDVASSIEGFGTNVLAIISGKIDTTQAGQANANPAAFIADDILTVNDIKTIETLPNVQEVAPISLVSGSLKQGDKTAQPLIFGTYPNFLDAFEIINVEQGAMFSSGNETGVIVLSKIAKEALFGEQDAIGKTVELNKETLKVIGILGKSKLAGTFSSEYDNMSLIPFDTATKLNKNQASITRIVVKANDSAQVDEVKSAIQSALINNHDGEEDFTVLSQDDMLGLFNTFLNLATTMVSAIASISLVVGGIGIMNIMLVTVTERTREIGLRKAVGATKFAILIQFLTEAIMVTLLGAGLGLVITFAVGALIAAKTELTPAITPQIIGIAVSISIAVGVIFGLWPALRAANKDPIEALRYE